jgi:hypothetical protein
MGGAIDQARTVMAEACDALRRALA